MPVPPGDPPQRFVFTVLPRFKREGKELIRGSNGRSYLVQRDLAAFLAISFRRLADIPSARALPPMRHGGGVLAVIRGQVVNLAGCDPHDMNRVADYIGRALL